MLLTVLVLAPSAAPAAPLALQFTSTLRLHGFFRGLAADGSVVIAQPDPEQGDCRFIPVWNATTHTTITQRGGDKCAEIQQVAVAGNRVAWTRAAYETHTSERVELVVAQIGTKPQEIGDAFDDGGSGTVFWGPSGDRDLLAFSLETNTDRTQERLYRIETRGGACPHQDNSLVAEPSPARRCVALAPTTDYHALDVDAGRILVSDNAGKLALLDRSGKLLHVYDVTMGPDDYEAVVSGDTIVVNRDRDTSLDAYSVTDGKLLWTAKVAGASLTAAGGFAAVAGEGLFLVRLADGAVVRAKAPGERAALAAALEPTGLFDLYVGAGPTRHAQRIGFEPLSRLRAAFAVARP